MIHFRNTTDCDRFELSLYGDWLKRTLAVLSVCAAMSSAQTRTSAQTPERTRDVPSYAAAPSRSVETSIGVSSQPSTIGRPERLPVVTRRPTRLPATAASTRLVNPITEATELNQPQVARLLSPTVSNPYGTLRGSTPFTLFDRQAFDLSIENSVFAFGPSDVQTRRYRTASAQLDTSTAESLPLVGAFAEQDSPGEPSPNGMPTSVSCDPSDACERSTIYFNDFSPTPVDGASMYHDSERESWVYDTKFDIPTQHPWVEWGRIFYGNGITPRGKNWFGSTNLSRPEFYLYGDFRSAVATGRNAAGRTDNWANRLNLDMDLKVTSTERFHAFVGPLNNAAQVTRIESVGGDLRYRNEVNLNLVTGFFEGDAGAMLGGILGTSSPFELPFTLGLVPLLFQNGIWMEDAVTGGAFSLPARHSRLLNWANYDATFFAVVDQLNSPAFGKDKHAAQAFGTAWFIEAYGGYIESGYAYVRDRNRSERSYHNFTTSFTRRYFDRISNSVRVIVNTGQDLPDAERTADGVLLLCENSWISAMPLTVVPYANFFVGWDSPQSVARAGVSGGILRNTGINFDTDGVNGLATLDPTASDTAGGSLGIDLIGNDLDRQLLLEFAYLTPHGSNNPAVPGDQYAVGTRFQIPVTNATLWRFDTMYGWRDGLGDVYGTRIEYRWKF